MLDLILELSVPSHRNSWGKRGEKGGANHRPPFLFQFCEALQGQTLDTPVPAHSSSVQTITPPKQPHVRPSSALSTVGQQKGRLEGGLCRLWIRDRCRLVELRDPLACVQMEMTDSVGDVSRAQRTPYPKGGARKKRVKAQLQCSWPRSYLALVAVDVSYGVGHRVRAQQHACAARPLGAHEVVFSHEDLAHVFCAGYADQRPPQQVRLEHVAILLPPRRLETGTLREPQKRALSGYTSPNWTPRRPSLEGPWGRGGGTNPGHRCAAPRPHLLRTQTHT